MINAKEMNIKTQESVLKIEKPKREASVKFCEEVLAEKISEAAQKGEYKIHVATRPELVTIDYVREYLENFGYRVSPWRYDSFFVRWN